MNRDARSKKATVIFATTVFNDIPNGPAIYASSLWNSFKDDDEFDFHVVAPKIDERHPNLHESGGLGSSRKMYQALVGKVEELATCNSASQTIIHGNNAYSMASVGAHLGHLVVQVNDYDTARCWLDAMHTIRRYGVKRLVSLAWRRSQERIALQRSDCVVCNSKFLRVELIERYQLARSKRLEVVYPSTDLDPFWTHSKKDEHAEDSNNSSSSELRILFVGANWIGKGLGIAIQAFAELAPEFPNLKLLVAGEGKSGRKIIGGLVSRFELEEQVRFLGDVSRGKMPDLFGSVDMLVFPSRNEAFGITVLEALAAGKPVVASNVGGVPEILKGLESSTLVDAEDVNGFAKAMRENLRMSNAKRRSARSESVRVSQKFTIDDMVRGVRRIYDTTLGLN